MNILFLSGKEVSPLNGGTERITHTLANEFMSRCGISCYIGYFDEESNIETTQFNGKIQLNRDNSVKEQLSNFIEENNIDIVLSNLVGKRDKQLALPAVYEVTRKTATKVIACYHAMPGEDLLGNTMANSIFRLRKGIDVFNSIKYLLLNILPLSLRRVVFKPFLKGKYRLLHEYSDKLVLLSESFYKPFADLAGIEIDDKFAVIHNALSFDEFISEDEFPKKKQEVMILSRMEEKSKRISFALKIWKRINQIAELDDWKLVLVGSGPDLEYLKRYAQKLKLKNYSFEGRQPDAIKYYKNASVFMLTSNFEGWGITLTEAQQMGTVPIAFHSYASLPDIIENGKNGIIVPNKEIDTFAEQMASLMQNKTIRISMAVNGLESCKRFHSDIICRQWIDLFHNLLVS